MPYQAEEYSRLAETRSSRCLPSLVFLSPGKDAVNVPRYAVLRVWVSRRLFGLSLAHLVSGKRQVGRQLFRIREGLSTAKATVCGILSLMLCLDVAP